MMRLEVMVMKLYFEDSALRQQIIDLLRRAQLSTHQSLQLLDSTKDEIMNLPLYVPQRNSMAG